MKSTTSILTRKVRAGASTIPPAGAHQPKPALPTDPTPWLKSAASIAAKQTQFLARRRALEQSPIGQRAAAIGRALAALREASKEFLYEHPDREAAEKAGTAALETAALLPVPDNDRSGWAFDHFAHLPEELRGWAGALDALAERLAHTCDRWDEPPADAPAEPKVRKGRATRKSR